MRHANVAWAFLGRSRPSLPFGNTALAAHVSQMPRDRLGSPFVMIQSIHCGTIVEMLLNSLEAERYVRRPLLCNIVDELSVSESYAPAADLARALLADLERGTVADTVFQAKLGELRECVRNVTRGGLGEARELARTAPRMVTGRPANAA